jgi:hypothetical protein
VEANPPSSGSNGEHRSSHCLFLHKKSRQTRVAPGCGTDEARFEMTKVKDRRPVTQPEAAKALVYFIEDDIGMTSSQTQHAGGPRWSLGGKEWENPTNGCDRNACSRTAWACLRPFTLFSLAWQVGSHPSRSEGFESSFDDLE